MLILLFKELLSVALWDGNGFFGLFSTSDVLFLNTVGPRYISADIICNLTPSWLPRDFKESTT